VFPVRYELNMYILFIAHLEYVKGKVKVKLSLCLTN
jgi:hypothetical protein